MAQMPQPGQLVSGMFFNEPMRVETVRGNGAGSWTLGLVGMQSQRFRSVILTHAEIATLKLLDRACSYTSDGTLLKLGLQANSRGIAYEFDPYFGLSISRFERPMLGQHKDPAGNPRKPIRGVQHYVLRASEIC